MAVRWLGRYAAILLMIVLNMRVHAQEPANGPSPVPRAAAPRAQADPDVWLQPGEDPENRLLTPFVKHLAEDQIQFWKRPFQLRAHDWRWAAPLAGFTGVLIASDSWMSRQVPASANQIQRSKNLSNYVAFSMVGLTGAAFAWGQLRRNDHLSETGLLGGEAAIDSTAVGYLLKAVTQRPRPYQGNGNGAFFTGGSSFPSEHSTLAWSLASIWAHQYPGKFSQLAAYGLATAVTIARVTGKQHFPADAFIGSALGWYLGRQVYRAHHDPELGGGPWGPLLSENTGEKIRNPNRMGSPYVPLDSWVYPALERLEALGYIQSAYLGMRPWSRMTCARLIEEAGEQTPDADANDAGAGIVRDLRLEFAAESARLDGATNLGLDVDSVYTRVTGISGRPLGDGYHFGQTIINDFGRPYGEGSNNIAGAVASAVAGPFSISFQGEYQHAPAMASDPQPVLNAIANADFTVPVANGRAEVNRFDLLEASVAVNVGNVRISFGKQSQWLGAGEAGSLLLSDNAEPIVMLKLESEVPFRVPVLSKLLGPMRAEYFLGRLTGHRFEVNGSQLLGPGSIAPQPFIDGAKVSFKPTANLEFGMGFTAQFVGPGLPFTWRDFARTFYVHNQSGPTVAGSNPAKRASSADFSYRVPGLRNWLTVYADTLVVDEISPIGSSRATVNPGIYMPQFPRVPRLELRAEGIHEPLTSEFAPGFVYYGLRRFRSGYTNDGNLMGSWMGRAGRGGQGWLTYNFTPRSSAQFGYRLQEVSKAFLGGGRLADYRGSGTVALCRAVSLEGTLQYEQWRFPVLSPARESNLTASVGLKFYPRVRTAGR